MTTFKSFSSGVTGKLKGKKAVGEFDKSMDEGFDEAWGTKRSKKKKKGSKKR
jgi:hypothetical protein